MPLVILPASVKELVKKPKNCQKLALRVGSVFVGRRRRMFGIIFLERARRGDCNHTLFVTLIVLGIENAKIRKKFNRWTCSRRQNLRQNWENFNFDVGFGLFASNPI